MIEELKQRHPHMAHVIKVEPLPKCCQCRGSGEYVCRLGTTQVCLCVCIGHPDDGLRMNSVNAFYGSMRRVDPAKLSEEILSTFRRLAK